ncbi:MAG: sigma 54-interacting transcriptional regulator [Vicinamibacterales bacterium]
MQLIADRFVRNSSGCAWDLATGVRVTLVMSTAGGVSDQAAWSERCAWLFSVSHARLAPLVDYGVVGETGHFEAWGATVPWTGAASSATLAARSAGRFLAANDRSAPEGAVTVGAAGDRAVLIPGAAAGRRVDAATASALATTSRGPLPDLCGRLHVPDVRLAGVLDLLESQRQIPSAVGIWLPQGSDVRRVVCQLARAARLGGRVPVSARLLSDGLFEMVRGRSLMVLSTDGAVRGWQALLQGTLRSGRGHVACFVGSDVVRRVHTVSLTTPTPDRLRASVVPPRVATQHVRSIATAARRARGSELRFNRLLFGADLPGTALDAGAAGLGRGRRAAEDGAGSVGGTVAEILGNVGESSRRAWPAPGDAVRLRKQVAQAAALLTAGRHRPGERLARQVMHALARRSRWTEAVDLSLHLAAALRRRGRTAAALEILDGARVWTRAADSLPHTLASALVRAELLIDDGQLGPAEAIIEPALAAALSEGHPCATDLLAAFARCLHWQGRDREAVQRLALGEPAPAGEAGPSLVRLWLMRSTVAAATGRLADAVTLVAQARDRAVVLGHADLLGHALECCAKVQLVAGDLSRVRAIVVEALPYARRAHAPLLAARLRLLSAEAARRLGDRSTALKVLARYGRTPAADLHTLVRARIALLKALLEASDPARAAVACAESTGLAGLRLFGPTREEASAGSTATADDLVGLLQCCHVATDERAVLAAVCARLRVRLGAAGVGFLIADDAGHYTLIGADGQRPDGRLAPRVASAQQLVLDDGGGTRPEAGVPVRCAGGCAGVLVAVWPAGARWHAPDVALLLSTGATAAGPALAAVKAARATDRRSRMAELLGISAAAHDIRSAIDRASSAPFPVLVDGESGVGKELVARLLHKTGPRRDRPFATMNCAALPDDLVESELFGHARGAFTGAVSERRGLFEEANGGTLFLDEVGELSLRAQAKLLRAIQEGEVRRVGENVSRRVDARLVAATNRDLRAETAAGRFRLDLLYRLDVLRITIPPLRDRREDIPILAEHLWRDAAGRVGSQAVLAPATLDALARHDWPGNVRELQNVLAALAVRCGRRGLVLPASLPPALTGSGPGPLRLDEARLSFDRAFITSALARTGGRRSRAARELGVSRQGLAKLIARLEIADGLVEPGRAV